jgi:hypothetical protein
MIRHFVLLRFRKDVSADTRAGLMRDLGAAVAAIEGCSGFAAFENVSVEAPLIHGFENGFVVDFADEAARRRYLDDPGHQAVGARLVAETEGGTEGVVVFDYAAH